ncbi:MAG: endonuclease/exonuclease/phosphatase family protein [Paracoccaceae bacterium]
MRGKRRTGYASGLILLLTTGFGAQAETYRVATWNVELSRKGPGLLLRDMIRGDDEQISAVLDIIAEVRPDILLLQGVDFDQTSEVLQRLAGAAGYDYHFAFPPNSGRQTGLDVDGDGRLGEPEDALGFGRFFGEGGMALLSRFPIQIEASHNYSDILWKDLPQTLMPSPDNAWPSQAVYDRLPLSSVGHWQIPIAVPDGDLTLMAFHASPPVFDGPEDRNGLRNHDQIAFWQKVMDGVVGSAPKSRFVVLGDANQDPIDGEGRKAAIRSLLADQRLQDVTPQGAQGTDTVDWDVIGVGKLRVDYVLPSSDLDVIDSGVYWPIADTEQATTARIASRHSLVWVDLKMSDGH